MKKALKDYSFGIIPLRKIGDQWQTFIVQQTNGYWSFPKGHAEYNESPRQTAERELFEETGLQVEAYFSVQSLSVVYKCHNKFAHEFEKEVTLFCALVCGEIVLCPVETLQGAWINVSELNKTIVFDSMQTLLKDLQNIVKNL